MCHQKKINICERHCRAEVEARARAGYEYETIAFISFSRQLVLQGAVPRPF